MEVAVLEGAIGAIEGVVRVLPCIGRCVAPAVPRRAPRSAPAARSLRCRLPRYAGCRSAEAVTPLRCVCSFRDPPGSSMTQSEVLPPSLLTYAMRSPAGDQRGAVASNSPSVALERVAALGGHEPELIPLPAEVGGVHHASTVTAPVGPSLPGGLFVVGLAPAAIRPRLYAPESSGYPDPAAVGHEDQLPAVPATTPVRSTGPVDGSSTGASRCRARA